MMLGKRGRPPMKRTTSMTEFTLDLSCGGGAEGVFQPLDPHSPFNGSCAAAAAPRLQRRNSAEPVETAHFLRICTLCKRRLVPGRDIYMYRGDSAFCSLECRQQQITQDERKEKCSLVSKKGAITTAATSAASQVSAAGGTVAAV